MIDFNKIVIRTSLPEPLTHDRLKKLAPAVREFQQSLYLAKCFRTAKLNSLNAELDVRRSKDISYEELEQFKSEQMDLIAKEYKLLLELARQEKIKQQARDALDKLELQKPLLETQYETASEAIEALLQKKYRL
jgi:hypothetical protein